MFERRDQPIAVVAAQLERVEHVTDFTGQARRAQETEHAVLEDGDGTETPGLTLKQVCQVREDTLERFAPQEHLEQSVAGIVEVFGAFAGTNVAPP